MSDLRAQPWYREPWPWILMAAPAAAIVGGLLTFWLAVHSDDGLVQDDYYKEGLAINETLSRAEAAARLGLRAELELAQGRVRIRLSGSVHETPQLRFVHPTRSGLDQRVRLQPIAPGMFEGQLSALESGRWHVILEQKEWRLAGLWSLPESTSLTLVPEVPGTRAADRRQVGD